MAYKTILTVLTTPAQMAQLDAAAALAQRDDGHLDVFCLGVDHSQAGYYYAGASAYVVQESIDKAMAAAEALEQTVREKLSGYAGLKWAAESAVAQAGGLTTLIAMRARYSDIMVQSLPYGEGAAPDAEPVTEAAMFEGGCPVLVLPDDGLPADPPRRVMIAWNQSSEAMTSVRRALPLLQSAEAVEITVIDPKPSGPERSDPGGALCQMLVRHGINAEIAVLARTERAISDILLRRATEIGADVIVMGAYGHSRFREAILGGATRNMLEKSTIPVLMAR